VIFVIKPYAENGVRFIWSEELMTCN
jgi:hypothetical protein